jgi:hypothetical protein
VAIETASANPADHRTLGIFWLLFGVLRVLGAVWMVLFNNTLTVMWGAILNRVPDPLSWMTMFHLFMTAAVVYYVILAIVSFLAGFALLNRSASAGTLALFAAILAVMSGPLGIALGVPTIVLFLPRGSSSS